MVAQCQLSLQAYARSIVHAASMLSVPRTVIKTVQDRIFKFLWKNKQDKVKRTVIYHPHCGKITTLELGRQVLKLCK